MPALPDVGTGEHTGERTLVDTLPGGPSGLPELEGERTVISGPPRMAVGETPGADPSGDDRAGNEPSVLVNFDGATVVTTRPTLPRQVTPPPVGAAPAAPAARPVSAPRRPVSRPADGDLQIFVEVGPDRGRRFTVSSQKPVRVGRGRDNDVILRDLTVSRHHLVLSVQHGQMVVLDQSSGNGTFRNGDELDGTVTVTAGDRLELGRSVLRLGVPGEHTQAASPTAMATRGRTPPEPQLTAPPAETAPPTSDDPSLSMSGRLQSWTPVAIPAMPGRVWPAFVVTIVVGATLGAVLALLIAR